jgi:hypothetical protein
MASPTARIAHSSASGTTMNAATTSSQRMA